MSATLTRRGAVAGALALPVGALVSPDRAAVSSAATPVAAPDAELIHLCGRFQELDLEYCRLHNGGLTDDEIDAAVAPLAVPMAEVLDRICALRASTPEGIRARGMALVAYAPEMIADAGRGDYFDKRMLGALLRDLTEAGAAA